KRGEKSVDIVLGVVEVRRRAQTKRALTDDDPPLFQLLDHLLITVRVAERKDDDLRTMGWIVRAHRLDVLLTKQAGIESFTEHPVTLGDHVDANLFDETERGCQRGEADLIAAPCLVSSSPRLPAQVAVGNPRPIADRLRADEGWRDLIDRVRRDVQRGD